MNATIIDLRYHMKDVLLAIDRGEIVTVLYRGKQKARLIPIAPASRASDKGTPRTEDQAFFGIWKEREDLRNPASYVRNVRQPRPVLPETSVNKRPGARKPK